MTISRPAAFPGHRQFLPNRLSPRCLDAVDPLDEYPAKFGVRLDNREPVTNVSGLRNRRLYLASNY